MQDWGQIFETSDELPISQLIVCVYFVAIQCVKLKTVESSLEKLRIN